MKIKSLPTNRRYVIGYTGTDGFRKINHDCRDLREVNLALGNIDAVDNPVVLVEVSKISYLDVKSAKKGWRLK